MAATTARATPPAAAPSQAAARQQRQRRPARPAPPRAATAAAATDAPAATSAPPAWPSPGARAAAFATTPAPELPSPTPAPLLSGALPPWLNGAFLRNGPGGFPPPYRHLFDGPAMLTRVDFSPGAASASAAAAASATQTQRFIRTAAWEGFKAKGRPVSPEFGTPLPFWEGLVATVAGLLGWGSAFDNASVTVRPRRGGGGGGSGGPGRQQVVAMTEAVAGTYAVDAVTLETRPGKVTYPTTDGVKGALTTAHAHTRSDGSLVSFTADVGRGFTVYTQDPATLARTPVASFGARPGSKGGGPGWIHDFPCTDAWACLPEAGTTLDLKASLVGGGEYVMFAWDEAAGARFTLVRLPPVRQGGAAPPPSGGTSTSSTSGSTTSSSTSAPQPPPPGATTVVIDTPEPLFFFHILNAFEDGGHTFHFDVPRFPDPTMVNRLGLDALRAPFGDAAGAPVPDCDIVRISLPLDGRPSAAATFTTLVPAAALGFFEFPQINPAWKGRGDYRFAYGVGSPVAAGPGSVGTAISKVDVVAGTVAAQWVGEPGGIPGEPLFVGRPGGEEGAEREEDDGVLLFHWTTPSGTSEVVVLEAGGLGEVARVGLPATVPYGFHGCWLPGG